jgi:hypothetical protein
MNMMDIRREGPASANPETLLSFQTFHDRTLADFSPCDPPDREPDFVSPSRSTYWDAGDRVIRSSDHWAGQNGCTGQASCIWTISTMQAPGTWLTGACAYTDFRRRQPIRLLRPAGPEEILQARMIRDQGAICLQFWIKTFGSGQIPPWARSVARWSPDLPPAAQAAFRRAPALNRAVTARSSVLERLLEGDGLVDLGWRLETGPAQSRA